MECQVDSEQMTPWRESAVAGSIPCPTLVAADLFRGAGGLSFGFQQAGFQIAFTNDINEEYAHTYRLNHDGTPFFRESIEDLNLR